jgi:hypothetical protein
VEWIYPEKTPKAQPNRSAKQRHMEKGRGAMESSGTEMMVVRIESVISETCQKQLIFPVLSRPRCASPRSAVEKSQFLPDSVVFSPSSGLTERSPLLVPAGSRRFLLVHNRFRFYLRASVFVQLYRGSEMGFQGTSRARHGNWNRSSSEGIIQIDAGTPAVRSGIADVVSKSAVLAGSWGVCLRAMLYTNFA